ncbi:Glucan endo-1,3-beta-glucosidase [Cytospora mali]|uniref:Glucan endo-1,3-beta-glucosidase n=1 Tax=Cytospora mali TaxID=578113 RepID=A0A194VD89_CYTMA|nr:Glucan endo-1,3-beta-glucosidase [Valsa mali var. pyri (nom. inval.)]
MRSLFLTTLAAMAAPSLLHFARTLNQDPPYRTSHALDRRFELSRKNPEPRRGSYLITRDEASSAQIEVTVHNARAHPISTYVTGVNSTSLEYLMLYNEKNGTFKWKVKPSGYESNSANAYYFTQSDSHYEIRVEANKTGVFYIPTYAASGRIYIANDTLRFGTNPGGSTAGFVEPSASNIDLPEYNHAWQFMEFTWTRGQFWINLSNLDFVSIPLGMTVVSKNTGSAKTVPGLVSNGTALVCKALTKQADADGYNWKDLGIFDNDNHLVRVLSPDQYLSTHAADPLNGYYDNYVDAVWEHYNKTNLTIYTQDSNSQATSSNDLEKGSKVPLGEHVSCRVDDDERLHCYNPTSGKSYNFQKPTTKEIFGCVQDGKTFQVKSDNTKDWTQPEIVPRLCAAFHRSTLLRDGGNIQPYSNGNNTAADYYCNNDPNNQYCVDNITNHYARVVHDHEIEGMGYAFAYDDTNPIGKGLTNASANAAGLISDPNPASITITVGL